MSADLAIAWGVIEALIGLLVVGLAVTIVVLGWDRYRRPRRSAALQPTSEVFIDPETGRRMQVWADPSTGERAYVEDAADVVHPSGGNPRRLA